MAPDATVPIGGCRFIQHFSLIKPTLPTPQADYRNTEGFPAAERTHRGILNLLQAEKGNLDETYE